MSAHIGITSFQDTKNENHYNSINENYTRSVSAAGGLPFILPYKLSDSEAEGIVSRLDGILFTGGVDIAPYLYGEDPIRGVHRISAVRDSSEAALFAAAKKRRMPIFGICRGCQFINVSMGGTLYQDLPSQLPKTNEHYPDGLAMDELFHDIEITEADSIIGRLFGARRLKTNSFHHQAIKEVGAGLRVSARCADGVIEAMQGAAPDWFVSAVQFHPEALTGRYTEFVDLFRIHVEAAERYARG